MSADEREAGPRRILNFGHTAGHALEAVTKYRRFRHGEAVALRHAGGGASSPSARGALADARSRRACASSSRSSARCRRSPTCRPAEAVEATAHDKKVVAGTLHFVLPTAIGATTTVTDVTSDELKQRADGDRAERRERRYSSPYSFSFASSIL